MQGVFEAVLQDRGVNVLNLSPLTILTTAHANDFKFFRVINLSLIFPFMKNINMLSSFTVKFSRQGFKYLRKVAIYQNGCKVFLISGNLSDIFILQESDRASPLNRR